MTWKSLKWPSDTKRNVQRPQKSTMHLSSYCHLTRLVSFTFSPKKAAMTGIPECWTHKAFHARKISMSSRPNLFRKELIAVSSAPSIESLRLRWQSKFKVRKDFLRQQFLSSNTRRQSFTNVVIVRLSKFWKSSRLSTTSTWSPSSVKEVISRSTWGNVTIRLLMRMWWDDSHSNSPKASVICTNETSFTVI